ncbi:MAG: hypothetical protein JXB39_00365 [Deltaproteobacteria bacterium]|nr:hypothetical protein [Deltaproteobacteria bacterium]
MTGIPQPEPVVVGLDVGALFVHGVVLGGDGTVCGREVRAHRGEVLATTRAVIETLANGARIERLGLTGGQAEPVGRCLKIPVQEEVGATLAGVRRVLPGVAEVVVAGGASLSLLRIAPDGTFAGYQTNTLCAAGTGSFLDEQAERLGLTYEDLPNLPSVEDPPDVAARCAVFAKSDLIHRQQEGYGKPALWAGLCRGLARTMVMTLFKGRTPVPPVALVGGVARNPEVVRGLSEEMGTPVRVPEFPDCVGALGAALAAKPLEAPLDLGALEAGSGHATQTARRPPLVLKRSTYPSFEVAESWVDAHGNEIRVTRKPEDGLLCGYLGVDVGSTSTKAALVDEAGEVVLDIYRRTMGDPIGATRLLFAALREIADRYRARLEILGASTTGSGRKIVGAVIGADLVVNEITAHVTGAMRVDSRIDTIFELGGQDAKYVHTVDGRLHDANLNYACAAGTGSFVEEIARKLGFELEGLGDALLGVEPPITSDRCTVFMEQDARHLLREGFTPREVMGAVAASVVQNYLLKVVGRRPRSRDRVFFQGATARNKALVAAFEMLLDVEVVVSPYCHVMGAWGAALLAAQALGGRPTTFLGLDLADREVRFETSRCTICPNRCTITTAHVEGLSHAPSWGYLCGRDPDVPKLAVNPNFAAFRLRDRMWREACRVDLPEDAPRLGMPRALLTHTYGPLFCRFFGHLGWRLVLSDPTDAALVKGSSEWVGGDYCFPVKVAHGHARQLFAEAEADRIRWVFVPNLLSEVDQDKTGRSWFCPYNLGLAGMIEAAARLRGADATRLLRATVDLRKSPSRAGRALAKEIGSALERTPDQVVRAWTRALEEFRTFEASLKQAGREVLDRALAGGGPVAAVLGRPYVIYDAGSNIALPEKLARLGIPVVPFEFLPLDEEPIGPEFRTMYWNFGRRLLEAARYVARTPGLFAVGFTAFSCGPDSFVWSYAERVMGPKPMLVLELDEHGADAGYLTRLEAFADVLKAGPTPVAPAYRFRAKALDDEPLGDTTLWLPPMHEASPVLAAAALRHHRFHARPLPLETPEAFLRGRMSTRGGECLPCPATLGTFVTTVEREGGGPGRHALFMPTAEGPCRFGQYATLDRMLLEEQGWDPVRIVSWTSSNSYSGLSSKGRRDMWTGLVLGDILFKMRCRVLPYERDPGATESVFGEQVAILEAALERGEPLEPLLAAARDAFLAIPRSGPPKPLVGIVGEIYVRLNRFTNQDVVRTIEAAGGEAWLAPLTEWVLYVAWTDSRGLGNAATGWRARVGAWLRNGFLSRDEARWMRIASPLLDDRHEPSVHDTVAAGLRWLPEDFPGESIVTVGRAIEFARSGASLVVNCAPFGCMPGALTSGILQAVEAETGVPMATMVYDGEGGGANRRIATYLANLGPRPQLAAAAR